MGDYEDFDPQEAEAELSELEKDWVGLIRMHKLIPKLMLVPPFLGVLYVLDKHDAHSLIIAGELTVVLEILLGLAFALNYSSLMQDGRRMSALDSGLLMSPGRSRSDD